MYSSKLPLRASTLIHLLILALLSSSAWALIQIKPKSSLRAKASKFKSLAESSSISFVEGAAEIDGSKLDHLIELTKTVPSIKLIVDFHNPNCPHCQNFAPIFESTAQDAHQSTPTNMFLKVDVTKYNFLVRKYGINFIPDVRVKSSYFEKRSRNVD